MLPEPLTFQAKFWLAMIAVAFSDHLVTFVMPLPTNANHRSILERHRLLGPAQAHCHCRRAFSQLDSSNLRPSLTSSSPRCGLHCLQQSPLSFVSSMQDFLLAPCRRSRVSEPNDSTRTWTRVTV